MSFGPCSAEDVVPSEDEDPIIEAFLWVEILMSITPWFFIDHVSWLSALSKQLTELGFEPEPLELPACYEPSRLYRMLRYSNLICCVTWTTVVVTSWYFLDWTNAMVQYWRFVTKLFMYIATAGFTSWNVGRYITATELGIKPVAWADPEKMERVLGWWTAAVFKRNNGDARNPYVTIHSDVICVTWFDTVYRVQSHVERGMLWILAQHNIVF